MDVTNGRIYRDSEVQQLRNELMQMKLPPTQTQMLRKPPRVGRNCPCPCGSGKKFKHCCLKCKQVAGRQKIEAERKRLADIEAARLRKIEDERIAREAAEKARIETEQRIAREAAEAKAKAEREAAEAKAKTEAEEAAKKRAEELRPDKEKIMSVAGAVADIKVPEFNKQLQDQVVAILDYAEKSIRRIANSLI